VTLSITDDRAQDGNRAVIPCIASVISVGRAVREYALIQERQRAVMKKAVMKKEKA
jgi:hypothetical protein